MENICESYSFLSVIVLVKYIIGLIQLIIPILLIFFISFDFIKGIGEKRKKELLKKYKSIEKLKEASIEDLCTLLPEKIAEDLYNFLHKED